MKIYEKTFRFFFFFNLHCFPPGDSREWVLICMPSDRLKGHLEQCCEKMLLLFYHKCRNTKVGNSKPWRDYSIEINCCSSSLCSNKSLACIAGMLGIIHEHSWVRKPISWAYSICWGLTFSTSALALSFSKDPWFHLKSYKVVRRN